MNRIIKSLVVAVSFGLLAALGFGIGNGSIGTSEAEEAPPPAVRPRMVTVEPVATHEFAETIRTVGTVRARLSIQIHPMSEGRVTEMVPRAAGQVEAGTLLLRLDDGAERAALAFAQATLVEAQAAHERARRLAEGNFSSQSSQEMTEATLLRAQAEVDGAVKALQDREVRAAFSGVLSFSDIDPGARVDPSDVIATLDDLSEVEVALSIPERFLAQIEIGQPILARSTAHAGRVFEGTVSAIDSRVSDTSRAISLRATIGNPEAALRAGMFLDVDVVLSARDSPAVPEVALVMEGDRSFVFVAQDGESERREVRTGASDDALVEVLDGVMEGEAVIVSDLHRIADGSPIEPNSIGGTEGPARSVELTAGEASR